MAKTSVTWMARSALWLASCLYAAPGACQTPAVTLHRTRNGEGGEKSNRSGYVVARRAATDSAYFNDYVRNPRRLNPASQMAASPTCAAATLRALRSYLSLFAETYP
jgi:hypothetical protein